jgi:hypothetical protein
VATTDRLLDAPIDAVASVLADARTYDGVVVGSKRIRWFDARWPEPGSSFHHSVGFGPLHIRDSTTATADELPHRLLLAVGMGPLGAAEVEFVLAEEGAGTRATMREDPVSGLVNLVWSPPVDAATRVRNDRALRRLEKAAQARARVRRLDARATAGASGTRARSTGRRSTGPRTTGPR